ncbi:hypothetical protein Shyd_71810 [Streptomyces hydrogenans]|uniref:Uncharacterized protein n=1 Tax=Streptomyces hydrogenans TaxID=1873719 RepID=A0ABQ3PLC0_9ACTN|nr:hypothetical protein Shyd_71810 [Streptomyces hydrogenans]
MAELNPRMVSGRDHQAVQGEQHRQDPTISCGPRLLPRKAISRPPMGYDKVFEQVEGAHYLAQMARRDDLDSLRAGL